MSTSLLCSGSQKRPWDTACFWASCRVTQHFPPRAFSPSELQVLWCSGCWSRACRLLGGVPSWVSRVPVTQRGAGSGAGCAPGVLVQEWVQSLPGAAAASRCPAAGCRGGGFPVPRCRAPSLSRSHAQFPVPGEAMVKSWVPFKCGYE